LSGLKTNPRRNSSNLLQQDNLKESSKVNNLLHSFDSVRLESICARFKDVRVAVIGDYFLDRYYVVDSSLAEPSLETGRISHQVVEVRHSPGAAGTVVNNLSALGAGEITCIGFTGEDGEGWELRKDLDALGCNLDHLHVDPASVTPTYLKPREKLCIGLEGEHERYDIKNMYPLSKSTEESLIASLRATVPLVDAVIVMDQVREEGCGALTNEVVKVLSKMAGQHDEIVFWTDSRGDIRRYFNITAKVNQFEVAGITDPAPADVVPFQTVLDATKELTGHLQAPVFTTFAERGVYVSGCTPLIVPAVKVEGPIDPTGAGDSFSAAAVLALASGATRPEAALVGNLAASRTVKQLGTTGTVTHYDLLNALQTWREQNL
jgi:rfaE bifunctional protein kinase chain/domain